MHIPRITGEEEMRNKVTLTNKTEEHEENQEEREKEMEVMNKRVNE